MRIGIYGGTFDPPHIGHMEAARTTMEALGLDQLLLIPAALPPHKQLPPRAASAEERLTMTALMADGLGLRTGRGNAVKADGMELARAGKSYTSDTLRQLHEQIPDGEFWLLMGADMLFTLPSWHESEVIAKLAGIAAFARSKSDTGTVLEEQARRLRADFGANVQVITLPKVIDLSSTHLRTLLQDGGGADLLWPPVYGYILMHGLYDTHADLTRLTDEQLRACSWSMIYAKRIPHVKGTEEEAVRLAKRWGADPELARRAGILHDCTKYFTLDEQLKLCDKYGIVLDDLEKKAVKLLHSKTGAEIARHVFGVCDEIHDAIYWHTTGKANMTTLEKVLYLADYIEPSRSDFEGLARLRKLSYEDLDAALLLGCELTIRDMEERGMPVHINTMRARDWLKGQSR